jgi:DNA-binding transcriptional ArsR family regulator
MYRCDKDYDPIEKQLARFMLALAHPARIAIIIRLAEEEAGLEARFINGLSIKESTLATHLRALLRAGLIYSSIIDSKLKYRLNQEAFSSFNNDFSLILNFFEKPTPREI